MIALSLRNLVLMLAGSRKRTKTRWTGYQPHYILKKYPCPKCLQKHPLDPITVVAECTATAHLCQAIINAWPSPFNDLISDWWTTATLGDRRNFIPTLIPNSLSNLLRSPPPALTYTQHRNHLYSAMKKQRQRVKTTLQDVQQSLRNNPIPDPHTLQPDTTDNPWKSSVSIYSTSAHHPTQLSFPKIKSPAPINKHPNKNALVLPAAQSLRQTPSTSLHLHSTGHSSRTLQCERRLSSTGDRGVSAPH